MCEDEGTIPGGPPGGDPGEEPPPLRYLRTGIDPLVGLCWYWARTPPGLDSWDPANDAAIINTRLALPGCPLGSNPAPTPGIPDIAWNVFRSFPLAAPEIGFEPAAAGITGLPTFLSAAPVAPIDYAEVLPGGLLLEVQARVASVIVDWGDGTVRLHETTDLRAYPDGAATHTYVTRTCSAAEREARPGGLTCHPTLDAYDVTVTYVWSGRYRYGAGWIELGTLDRLTTERYDVDEVVGVLEP